MSLGSAGHWAIAGARAFTASEGGIDGIDLTTGATVWHAAFPSGLAAWDAEPTLGLTVDGASVIAVRTVDSPAGPALEVLTVEAATGTVAGSALVAPADRWRVDLPPRVLAADAAGIVIADDPESGSQVGAITLPAGALAWRVEDQAISAGDLVITRSGARSRLTGEVAWTSSFPLGTLVGQTADVVVTQDDGGQRVVWLDLATGTELTSVPAAPEDCLATATAVVCLGDGVSGYDLASGRRLWSASDGAEAVTGYRDWAYLWRAGDRGDVVDSRTGEVVVRNGELPRIRYSNEAGILVDDGGYAWVARR